jgi:hypothetical protein
VWLSRFPALGLGVRKLATRRSDHDLAAKPRTYRADPSAHGYNMILVLPWVTGALIPEAAFAAAALASQASLDWIATSLAVILPHIEHRHSPFGRDGFREQRL